MTSEHRTFTAPTPGEACTRTYSYFRAPEPTRIVLFCPAGHELLDTPISSPSGKRIAAGDYSGEACPACGWEQTIKVTLDIENIYTEHGTINTTAEAEVPAPPTDPDNRGDWEGDYILPHTGAGLDGDAGYFVTITQSSNPDRLPVGTKIEFC